MRIVFMGTPAFAVASLEACVAHHDVVAVYTQPDKPKGRGKKMAPPEVKVCAEAHGIEVHQPLRVKTDEVVATLSALKPDVIVVVAYGQILSKAILDIPTYGCVNVHGSLLPKYRGAAPIHWAIADGEKETGITTMLMDEGLDTGDMLLKRTCPIGPETTTATLEPQLAEMGAELLVETLAGLEAGTIKPEKQEEALSCYAKLLSKQVARIDWSLPAVAIENRIRAFNPRPVAHTCYNGETLKIFKAEVVNECRDAACGEVVQVDKKRICVQTGDGLLCITELQVGSQKRMATSAYLLGRTIEVGTVFTNSKEA